MGSVFAASSICTRKMVNGAPPAPGRALESLSWSFVPPCLRLPPTRSQLPACNVQSLSQEPECGWREKPRTRNKEVTARTQTLRRGSQRAGASEECGTRRADRRRDERLGAGSGTAAGTRVAGALSRRTASVGRPPSRRKHWERVLQSKQRAAARPPEDRPPVLLRRHPPPPTKRGARASPSGPQPSRAGAA